MSQADVSAQGVTPTSAARDSTASTPIEPKKKPHSVIAAVIVLVWILAAAVFAAGLGLDAFGELSKSVAATAADTYQARISAFGLDFAATHDQLAVLVGACSGVLGAAAFSAWAAAVHLARKEFGPLWSAWYFVRIFLGAILGAMIVLAVSAGLITGGSAELSPAGTAVMGFIVGLAAKKAMDKFEELIDVLFGRDSGPAADSLTARIGEVRALEAKGHIDGSQAKARIEKILAD